MIERVALKKRSTTSTATCLRTYVTDRVQMRYMR